jgi:hypothetical protein
MASTIFPSVSIKILLRFSLLLHYPLFSWTILGILITKNTIENRNEHKQISIKPMDIWPAKYYSNIFYLLIKFGLISCFNRHNSFDTVTYLITILKYWNEPATRWVHYNIMWSSLKVSHNKTKNIVNSGIKLNRNKEPSWSWSYGSWVCNYLCNKCLSLRRGVLDTTLCEKVYR